MLTHTHEERQPGTTSPVRFENLRCATAALPCCWLTRRDELLHVRDCWGNCREPQQSHNSPPPNQALRMQREWGRGRDQKCWNDCRLFLTQRWGNSADWQVLLQQQERTTAAVPLFSSSACPVVTLTRRACARGDQGLEGRGFYLLCLHGHQLRLKHGLLLKILLKYLSMTFSTTHKVWHWKTCLWIFWYKLLQYIKFS